MEKSLKLPGLALGVCYYPEHWPKELWKSDLERMKEAGIRTVRVAEFAWNLTEPEDGVFVYDFWDEFLNLAAEMDMGVIFGTPTATPPAWLSQKHPEILNCDENGMPYHHGARRHYNYNSVIYQEYCKRIVTVLAKHYGNHPAIVGWQIDNEINCELSEFYSEADDLAFRSFLKEKYGTLEHLNTAWGTVFWNQTYTDWSMVHIPTRVINQAINPHLHLDYFRFISKSARNFAKLQSDILRKYIRPGVFVTTNGLFGNLDNHQMTEESLDFMCYDSYPNFAFDLYSNPKNSKGLNDRKWSRNLSEVRSISPNFGIMEQQSGANGWNSRMEAPAPKPGQLKLWTMQSVAHGADYISYFRWRTCTMGTEIYWHGILDYDNRDNRKLAEVRQVRDTFKAISELAGSKYQASFAVLCDYDNIWDAQTDRWHSRLERQSREAIFNAAQLTHTPMDYLYLREDTTLDELLKYPLLFYPHPAIMTEKRAKLLSDYAAAGGNLIFGCRAGYKQENGQCVMMPAPGLLADLCGADVKDFTFIGPADGECEISVGTGYEVNGYLFEKEVILDAPVFCDIMQLRSKSARVLGRFENNYFKGEPALVCNPIGKGRVFTLGTCFSEKNVTALLSLLGAASPYDSILHLPKTCELAVRRKGNEIYYIILNYQPHPVCFTTEAKLLNLETGRICPPAVTLPAYGVCVLKGLVQ